MSRRRLAFLAATAALGLLLGQPTHATQVQTVPGQVVTLDRSGTITAGGAAQTAIAANPLRKGWCIQNDPSSSEVLYVRTDGVASATAGTALQAGQQVCNPSSVTTTAAISVFAATTSHRWFGVEFQ